MPHLLTRDEEIVSAEVSFGLPFPSVQRDLRRGKSEQALWLSEAEAELLVSLCITAAADGGDAEQVLFSKLGGLVRSFSR